MALGAHRVGLLGAAGSGADYVAEVLADSPVSYWRMADASGNITDEQGVGHLVATGSPTYSEPTLVSGGNDSIKCTSDSSNQYFSTFAASYNNRSAFTIECWMKCTADPGANSVAVTKWKGSTNDDAWYLAAHYVSTSGPALVVRKTSGGTAYISSASAGESATFFDGNPHHLVGTYDGTSGDVILYMDGAAVTTTDNSGGGDTTDSSGTAMVLWQYGDVAAARQPDGCWIDEVAFYNSALSSARVLAHYNAGI